MKKLLIPLAALTLLAACGGPSHGVIEAKHYDAPYTTYDQMCTTWRITKYGSTCIAYIHIPEPHPAEYSFKLKTSKHEGWTDVDATDFHRYQVGQYYP